MCLFTFKQIVPRLIELDDVISFGGAENGSCLGRWNCLPRPCWSYDVIYFTISPKWLQMINVLFTICMLLAKYCAQFSKTGLILDEGILTFFLIYPLTKSKN